MKLKFVLCLALVLSGGLASYSQNYEANEAARVENNREIIRLAVLIDSNQPPVTEEMLQTGDFNGRLFELNAWHESEYFKGADSDNARELLLRLTRYSYPPEISKIYGVTEADYVHEGAARVLTSMAAPAVVPVLQRWLTNNLTAAEQNKPCQWGELNEAIRDLSLFHETNMVPWLVAAWQKGVFEKKLSPLLLSDIVDMRFLRQNVIQALTGMPLPAARKILSEAMNDKRLEGYVRYPAAAALVQLGDPSARDFLLDGLEKYLAPDQPTQESSRYDPAEYELEGLGDTNLISAIAAKAAAAERKRPKLVMTYLVEQMRINDLSLEELRQIAASGHDLNRRLPAITILGNIGKADDLHFLESLLPEAEKYRGLQGQRDNLVRTIKGAIRNVQWHNWREFSE